MHLENGKDLVGLKVKGYDQMLLRSPKQFLAELRNSALIGANVTSLNHPMVGVVRRGLVGGVVFGEVDFHKAGSSYVIDEGHPSITDKNNANYGKVKVGDQLTREKDGFYADGLLSYQLNERAETILVNAVVANSIADEFDAMFTTTEAAPSAEAEVDFAEVEVEAAPAAPATTTRAARRGK